MAKGSNVCTFRSCAPTGTPAESSQSLNKICSETPDSETQASEISSFPALFPAFFCLWCVVGDVVQHSKGGEGHETSNYAHRRRHHINGGSWAAGPNKVLYGHGLLGCYSCIHLLQLQTSLP